MLLTVSPSQIFGCTANASDRQSVLSHLVDVPGCVGVKLHQTVIEPLQELRSAAKSGGFNLMIASGFRSFERQLLIWNKKCDGQRPVLDDLGCVVNVATLSVEDKLNMICRWSALPGASRHHWGTECDIYDAAAVPEDYQLQLHPKEYLDDGPFAPMMNWLDNYLQQVDAPEFYRPYLVDHNGVAPEPWHISYRPVASIFEKYFSLSELTELLQGCDIREQQAVLENLEKIYQRFIRLQDSNYPV